MDIKSLVYDVYMSEGILGVNGIQWTYTDSKWGNAEFTDSGDSDRFLKTDFGQRIIAGDTIQDGYDYSTTSAMKDTYIAIAQKTA
jgi:hypothetical protein